MKSVRKSHIDRHELHRPDRPTLTRILRQLAPHWRRTATVTGAIAGASILNLAFPFFVKHIVDVAIPQHNQWLLLACCAGMIAGPLFAGLLQVVQKYQAEAIGQRVMLDLRVALYRRLHEMPFGYFTKQSPGEAVSKVLNDVQGVGGAISGTLVDIAQNAALLVSTFAFIAVLDWRLTLVAAAVLPAFVMPARRAGRARKRLKRSLQAHVGELTGILTEMLSVSGALLVKVFGTEEAEVRRFRAKAEAIERLALRQTLVGRWFQLILGLFEAIGPAIVFGVGGLLVIRGQIALGTVVAFVTVLKQLYKPASELSSVHVEWMTSCAYFERVFDVLDRVPAIRNAEGATSLNAVEGKVEFRDVSFAYDSQPALTGINLLIPAGKTVALVGPSGSGKSTVASLLMRLYDPGTGAVLMDGVDIRTVTIESLRRQIACVTQDNFLMHTTVLDNLRYGRPDATRAEVDDAARRAHIDHLIADLPDGYDTIVGERGYLFSAGERQRLAIARAILKDPRILILDEATSSLDSGSEGVVQDALVPLMKSRTTLVIAHRLSTIRDADLILVVERGHIVERGTHDELMARAGLYAWLWNTQGERRAGPNGPQRKRDEQAERTGGYATAWRDSHQASNSLNARPRRNGSTS